MQNVHCKEKKMKKYRRANQSVKRVSTLAMAVSSLMLANTTTASDLEIYKNASSGGGIVMMMFDNSGSMNAPSSIPADNQGVNFPVDNAHRGPVENNVNNRRLGLTERNSINVIKEDGTVGTTLNYDLKYYIGSDNKRYYDRMSILKRAVLPIFANPKTSLGENYLQYIVGVGSFFYQSGGTTANGDNGGKIDSPAVALTYDNRVKLLKAIIAFNPQTSTPIAHAYAEAAAYMLGTTTKKGNITQYNAQSGFDRAGSEVKKQNGNYVSPIGSDTSCKGNGIYFLTDGEPNSVIYHGNYKSSADIVDPNRNKISTYWGTPVTKESFFKNDQVVDYQASQSNGYYSSAEYFNKTVLGTTPYDRKAFSIYDPNTLSAITSTRLSTSTKYRFLNKSVELFPFNKNIELGFIFRKAYDAKQGWDDIGYLAKHLYNPDKNPKKVSIKTATVGFGADFAAADGAETCAVISSTHARNLCLLGKEGEGYGEGGFTYAGGKDAGEKIAKSLVKFITEQGSTELKPISTGAMSVPLDAINLQKSRGFAYLPILDPKPGQTDLWNGNLKKYYTHNSNVVDGSMAFSGTGTVTTKGKPVLNNNGTGEFNTNTYDIWNTLRQADNAQPQTGGSFSNILENADIQPARTHTRNLFINTGNILTSVTVNANTRKPVGFTTVQSTLKLSDKNTPMNNILEFLGYPAQAGALNDSTPIQGSFDKTKKKLGGVLHSLPQVVTHEVTLNAEGDFDTNTRKDSILYGSMDGALHLLDDKTGKEWFTFIPKELIELQANALTGGSANGTTGSLVKDKTAKIYEDNSYPHGVDAPWHVYNNYALTKAGNKTQYKALQTFASGGLRMGGSTYYSLDISDKTNPKYIYSIGSNYANTLQNTIALQGLRDSTAGTTPEHTAYARMGQSWGKPAVGFVKSGGKKVMVHFLPGGYDICYERPDFKLNDATTTDTKCRSKPTAQGNAVYMVQVAEEKTNPQTKVVTMETNSNSGKLLWWATNGNGTDGKTQRSASLQASQHQDLKHSIVAEIRTVDRNYDGLTDHIYFADLGGQVWRADINNNASTHNTTKTDDFKIDRVVKILDVSNQVAGTDTAPRFYERPLFTVTNEVDKSGGLSGVITVGTGNRSNPVSDTRSKPEAIYTIIDKDVGRRDLFCYQNNASKCQPIMLTTKNITVADLDELKFEASDANIKTNMKKLATEPGYKQGWYFPLKTWATKDNAGSTKIENVDGLKMFNEPDAQAKLLFVTTYNPNTTTAGNSCSAGIVGETQRTLMCLPFGNCASNVAGNYTDRSFSKAGIGIVDNILTQSSPWDNSDKGKLFGTLCTSGECEKDKIPTKGKLEIDKVGVDLTRVFNPRDWWEK